MLAALLGIEDLATGLPVSKTGTLTAEQTAASQIHSCANSGFARMVRVWASMVLKIETLVGSMLCGAKYLEQAAGDALLCWLSFIEQSIKVVSLP